MNRGEVWWANFDLSLEGGIKKKHSAILVSNDASNRFLNRVQVVPLTLKTRQLYPSEACVQLRGRQNKTMADQLTTVSKLRLLSRAGRISDADMDEVGRAMRIQPGLSE